MTRPAPTHPGVRLVLVAGVVALWAAAVLTRIT